MNAETEIRSLFDRYLTAWNARDFERVAGCYCEPSLFILPGAVVPVEDKAALIALLGSIFAALENDNFSHTEIGKLEVCPRGGSIATADATGVRRLRKDGTEIEVIDAHYVLRRSENGWQFATAATLPHHWSDDGDE